MLQMLLLDWYTITGIHDCSIATVKSTVTHSLECCKLWKYGTADFVYADRYISIL